MYLSPVSSISFLFIEWLKFIFDGLTVQSAHTSESSGTVEPRLSGPRLSGLFDYPDFFSGPVFFMNINKL